MLAKAERESKLKNKKGTEGDAENTEGNISLTKGVNWEDDNGNFEVVSQSESDENDFSTDSEAIAESFAFWRYLKNHSFRKVSP